MEDDITDLKNLSVKKNTKSAGVDVDKLETPSTDVVDKDPSQDNDMKVKLENLDISDLEEKIVAVNTTETGAYKSGPRYDDSDDSENEFEPESDESAPSDDDAESHLGLMRKRRSVDKPKKRKRRANVVPSNAKVMYMTNSQGVKVKKFSAKLSTKFIPGRPWIPYQTQVTVDQVCKFLEMKDYPIPVTEGLKESFKNKQIFNDYATPLFRRVNPKAHPLVLETLVKAKWFEVMNTFTEEKESEKMDTEDNTDVVHKPKPKKIKLNFLV